MAAKYAIHKGDVVTWCEQYDGPRFSATFFDPPYNLESITKRYGKSSSKPTKGGVYGRTARGFMGQTWDTDVFFDPATWAAISMVLEPGAFGGAFSSTRTYHRMATAIEDAGFIIHPMMVWKNKQGFPKGTRIDTKVDEYFGEKVEHGRSFNYKGSAGGTHPEAEQWEERTRVRHEPISPMAKAWAGHRYDIQTLRPCIEPICIFQKPHPDGEKTWKSIYNRGTGAMNIKGAWIEGGEPYTRNNSPGQNGVMNASGGLIESDGSGWPANYVVDDEIADETDEGFFHSHYMYERLEDADPVIFAAKASIAEREAGLDAIQRRIMTGKDDLKVGTVSDGRQTVNDTAYQRGKIERRNIHATVKPGELCRHIATLFSPPDHDKYKPRRMFVPCAGVASEMVGTILSGGWEEIVGVELMDNHVEIAKIRLEYWSQMYDIFGTDILDLADIKLKKTVKKIKGGGSAEQLELL